MPPAVSPTPHELRQTYRTLYKACLAAVRYSSPARYMARDCIRAAFRDESRTANSSSFWSGRPSTAAAPLSLFPPASLAASVASAPTSTTSTPPFTSSPSPSSSSSSLSSFNRRRIDNTLVFLKDAAAHRGMAQKIVRNLLHARYWQQETWKRRWRDRQRKSKMKPRAGSEPEVGNGISRSEGWDTESTQDALARFEETIRMLNHDMDMCLQV